MRRISGSARPDLVLPNGLHVEVKAGRDAQGSPVISQLVLWFPDGKIPDGGIGARMLQELRLQDLLPISSASFSEYLLSEVEEKELLDYIRETQVSSGRVAYPDLFYAGIAYLYEKTSILNPKSPNAVLAEELGITARAMAGRVAECRARNFLSQQSTGRPSGRAGGTMSDTAKRILDEFRSDVGKTK